MPPVLHAFDWPDRFVVGTVGAPGARTFFLQARTGTDIVSVSLEKEQTTALADKIDEVLDELMSDDSTLHIPAITPDELLDDEPLEQPVTEQFRVGSMSLGWDPSTAQIVIEAFPVIEIEVEAELLDDGTIDPASIEAAQLEAADAEPTEVLQVRIPVGSARAFAKRTRDVVKAGRPLCSLCGQPMESEDDHVCELPDGFR